MKKNILFLSVLATSLLGLPGHGEVKLPMIFGDHMVLQEGKTLPVWGTASPGEKVTVTIGADSDSATAGGDGAWRVDLKPLPVSSTGTTLTVAGTNTLTFQDVVVGDVWLASGQSNMELPMKAIASPLNVIDIKKVIAEANNHPLIRIFLVKRNPALTPRPDVAGGMWKVSSPESVSESSAVAYFFAQILQDKLQRPIGVIDSYWGGQPIETFTSREALQPIPELKGELAKSDGRRAAWLAMSDDQRAAAMADYNAKIATWMTNVDIPYQAVAKKWRDDALAAQKAGQPQPPKPPAESVPRPPSPDGDAGQPAVLFNGMIAPLIPYAIKGALWYQGESNARECELYGTLLPRMIGDWRTRWSEGDFPFLVVGLANFTYRYPVPVDQPWARVREAQVQTSQKVANVAVAEAIDIGQAHNIHPIDKFDVGRRLAAAALHVAYGQEVPWVGPTFAGMKIDADHITIQFANTGAGLTIGQSPYYGDNPPPPTDHLVGFAVAGQDRQWAWADAKIEGDNVLLSSAQVANPVAVRYGWAANPAVNLYNKEGFPAEPFRTDDWPMVPAPPPPANW
jgi:sialate O-acetylesterase